MSKPTNASFEISAFPERNEITQMMPWKATLKLMFEVLDFDTQLRFVDVEYLGEAFSDMEAVRAALQNFLDDGECTIEPSYGAGVLARLKWSDVTWHTIGSEFWDKAFREILELKKQRGNWFQPSKMLESKQNLPELTSEEIAEIEKEAEAKFPTPPQAVHGAHYATRTKHKRDGFIAGATLERRRAKADKEGATAECLRSKERNGWIPVKERLPEQHGVSIRYLAYIGYGRMRIAWFNGRNFVSDGEELEVTHWQGLPDPPKE